MSRIGKMPIAVPDGVKVSVEQRAVRVLGAKGSLEHELPEGISARLENGKLQIERRDDSKRQRALHGLARSLLANAVRGVTEGFSRSLEIHGVGYRAALAGQTLNFSLGYTHKIEFPIPEGIQIKVQRNTRLEVSGCDRQQVGQVAADIRALRPPDVYKQKGIRYAGEVLRKKAGKTAAGA